MRYLRTHAGQGRHAFFFIVAGLGNVTRRLSGIAVVFRSHKILCGLGTFSAIGQFCTGWYLRFMSAGFLAVDERHRTFVRLFRLQIRVYPDLLAWIFWAPNHAQISHFQKARPIQRREAYQEKSRRQRRNRWVTTSNACLMPGMHASTPRLFRRLIRTLGKRGLRLIDNKKS